MGETTPADVRRPAAFTLDRGGATHAGLRRAWLLAAALVATTPLVAASHGTRLSALAAQEWKEFRSARHVGEYDALELEVVYGVGELSITPVEGPYLYDVRMRFDAGRFVPVRSWNASADRARLRVALTSARSGSEGLGTIRLDDFDLEFDLDDLRRLGDSAGRLQVALSRDVPTHLRVHVGAAESRLELGGLPLTQLELNTGASETRLSFGEPNPVRMERLQLKAGAAQFRAEQLGNAGFERFSFEGGVGDVVLDFTGEWRGAASASIKMGVGALKLRVPRDLGVRIRKKSFLTSFDAAGFTRVNDTFQSTGWESASLRLDLDLEAAFGSIEVELVP